MKSFLKQINESFQSLDEKQERWQDNDGDGKWYEPGVDVKEDIENLGKYKPKKYDRDGDGVPNGADSDPDDGDVNEELNEDEIEEASTSAGAGAYMTKNFVAKRKQTNPNLKQSTGYTDVPKTKLHTEYDYVQEAMDHKYEQLIEGYRDFALSDAKMSPAKKVNASIREVAKKLKEIEETIKYTGRLKEESGIAHSGFSSGTHNALRKISERLIKISERVRSLGE
jgi:glucan-binding YG repeat protein